jgi:hypothetical protein
LGDSGAAAGVNADCVGAKFNWGYATSSAGLGSAGAPNANEGVGSFFSAGLGDGGAAGVAVEPKLKAVAGGLGAASSFFSLVAPKLNAGAGEAGVAVEVPKLNDEDGAGAGEAAAGPKLKAEGAFAGVSSFLAVEAPKPLKAEVVGVSSFLAGSAAALPNLKPEEGAGEAGAGVAPKLLKGDDWVSGWFDEEAGGVDAPKLNDVEAAGAGAGAGVVDEKENEGLDASGCV